MVSQGWSFSRIETSHHHSNPQPEAEPPRLPYFVPQPAEISRPISHTYQSNRLLNIPQEIRETIWEIIYSEIKTEVKSNWLEKPVTEYDTLVLVCRAIYLEVSLYWRRAIVPRHRLSRFLNQPYNKQKLLGFKQLAVEIPFNCSPTFFNHMAEMLNILSPYLHDLKLFFTGCDAYGTRVHLHGCGNEPPTAVSRSKKLPIDGQEFRKRAMLFLVLTRLSELRTLVLSNSNFAYLQRFIVQNKNRLRKLFIVDDPRASLTDAHWKACMRSGTPMYGLFAPVTENFPPVKDLHISANSALTSVQVVNKLSTTLESLTWIVPDLSRQSGGFRVDWHQDTAVILQSLRCNSTRLHTLRICFEGAIYEAQAEYGNLIAGVKQHLPFLKSVRAVELHFWSKSPYIVREFLNALPTTVERLYVADKFITASQLQEHIASLLLLREHPPPKHLYSRDRPGYQSFEMARSGEGRDMSSDKNDWFDTAAELKRRDYICVRSSDLGFIGYEYSRTDGQRVRIIERQDSHPAAFSGGNDITHPTVKDECSVTTSLPEQAIQQRLELLKLNGRLLDRERNKHLASHEAGMHIDPTPAFRGVTESNADHVSTQRRQDETQSQHPAIEAAVARLEAPSPSTVRTNLTLLGMSPLTDDEAYFGSEKEAEAVFASEEAASVDTVVARRWCEEVVVLNGSCHWQSD